MSIMQINLKSILLYLAFALGIVGYSILIAFVSDASAPVCMLLSTISIFLIASVLSMTKIISGNAILFIAALALLLILPFQAKYNFVPLSGTDWIGYERHVSSLMAGNFSIVSIVLSSETMYAKIIAIAYCLLEANTIIPYFISYWSYLISLICLCKAMGILQVDSSEIRLSLLFLALSPIELVFAVSYLREMPMQMLSAVVLFFCLKYRRSHQVIDIFLAIVFAVIAAMLHSAMIALLVIVFGAIVSRNSKQKGNLFNIFAVLFIVALLMSFNVVEGMTEKFGDLSADSLIETASYSAGNTTYISGSVNSVFDLVLQLPYRLLMFSFAPFPWQFNNVSIIISFLVASIPQYYIILRSIKGLKSKDKLVLFVFIAVAALYVICAIGTNNFGTAIRHRVKMYPVMCALLGYTISRREKRNVGKHVKS